MSSVKLYSILKSKLHLTSLSSPLWVCGPGYYCVRGLFSMICVTWGPSHISAIPLLMQIYLFFFPLICKFFEYRICVFSLCPQRLAWCLAYRKDIINVLSKEGRNERKKTMCLLCWGGMWKLGARWDQTNTKGRADQVTESPGTGKLKINNESRLTTWCHLIHLLSFF
jgi:hypothetical protein